MSENIFYRRVSSAQQSLDRQVPPEGLVITRVFEEKVSGSSKERPALTEMIRYIRAGDHVYVSSIDRLARNLQDLQALVDAITKKDTSITFMKEGLNFSPDAFGPLADPFKKLSFNILGAFAEFERSMIRNRQQEGIERAKAEGKYTGRKPHLNYELVRALLNYGRLPREIADWLDIGIASVYRIKKQTEPKTAGWSVPKDGQINWQDGPLADWTPSDLLGFIRDVQEERLVSDQTEEDIISDWLLEYHRGPSEENPYSDREMMGLGMLGVLMRSNPLRIEEELGRLEELEKEARALIWTKAEPDGKVDRRRIEFLKSEGHSTDEVAKITGVDGDVIQAIWSEWGD